jgi:catechol 2,3-dioxygenase-like lactoylglutathione lyase family enzyme
VINDGQYFILPNTKEGDMTIIGLDHLVVNTRDVEKAVRFYRDVLGLEILRLEEFREGKVGFVSARVSPETIIDIRPDPSGEKVTPNLDHYCLVLGPTDMKELHSELKAKGIRVEEEVRPAWGAQGYGQQFKIWDPEGNKIELRCYAIE